MPALITKRGKKRWRASVMVEGTLRQKLFPDATKISQRKAMEWENRVRKDLEKKQIGTDFWTILNWADEYLDYGKECFVIKTYQEKCSVFKRFIKHFDPDMLVSNLTPYNCLNYLRLQYSSRSGYAANKDRKNLATAWEWGRKYLSGFPQDKNPIRSADKFTEKRSPRYIPSEEDFWSVYNIAEGQDKVMLLAFLHLAGRRSEIFSLTWADVSFEKSWIRLWANKRKGGSREYDWLPITTELRKSLMMWSQYRPIKDSPYVFVCLDNTPFCDQHYGKPFKSRQRFVGRLCEKAKVKPFCFHAIRHLSASMLYHKGYDVAHIQMVLRHKNPNTTSRYLKSLGLEQVRNVLEEGLKEPAKVIKFEKRIRESA